MPHESGKKAYAQHWPTEANRATTDGKTNVVGTRRAVRVARMSRVVVAGDVHLGAANADGAAFDGFLDSLSTDAAAIDELVLLGDCWDMVRRDPFGVAWETTGTIDRLKQLADTVPIRCVLGNHDGCLDGLDPERYEVEFRAAYTIEQGETTIHCRHGNDFDRLQFERLSWYLSGAGDRGEIDPTAGAKDGLVADGREFVGRLKSRLPSGRGASAPDRSYPRRERRAHDFLETIPADKLVFGHTHAPYVHHENTVGNPGSWKTTAPVHNTYIEILDGELALYQYRGERADERLA